MTQTNRHAAGRPIFALLVVLFTLFAIGGKASAQSIAVQPVHVKIAPGGTSAAITLMNRGRSPTAFQVRGYAWSQTPDQVIVARPDSHILASPPLGTIAPGGTQTVRVLLTKPPGLREGAYRLLIDEIPPPAAPNVVRIAVRMSIPVFAEPPIRVAPKLAWKLVRRNGKLVLSVTNAGTRHASVTAIRLTGHDGDPIAIGNGELPYVLAGATRDWVVPPASLARPGTALTLTADTEYGHIHKMLRVPVS